MKRVKVISFILMVLTGAWLLMDHIHPLSGVKEAGSIGIIGGADGPTAIYTTARLAPHVVNAIFFASFALWLALQIRSSKK